MKSKGVGKLCQKTIQRVVEASLNFFLNDIAFYVEIVTSHKLFFDIFFELFTRCVKSFKMS